MRLPLGMPRDAWDSLGVLANLYVDSPPGIAWIRACREARLAQQRYPTCTRGCLDSLVAVLLDAYSKRPELKPALLPADRWISQDIERRARKSNRSQLRRRQLTLL